MPDDIRKLDKTATTHASKIWLWKQKQHSEFSFVHISELIFRRTLQLGGILKGAVVKYVACAWAGVQLDFSQGYEPWYATFGTMPVDFEVQKNH